MLKTKGAIAEIPVNIKNSFNLPFSFLARSVSTMPKIRNESPKAASIRKNGLSTSQKADITKYATIRTKVIIRE